MPIQFVILIKEEGVTDEGKPITVVSIKGDTVPKGSVPTKSESKLTDKLILPIHALIGDIIKDGGTIIHEEPLQIIHKKFPDEGSKSDPSKA